MAMSSVMKQPTYIDTFIYLCGPRFKIATFCPRTGARIAMVSLLDDELPPNLQCVFRNRGLLEQYVTQNSLNADRIKTMRVEVQSFMVTDL